ncbi:hypothetical protein N7471_002236 [Penicillium samsonianum]|uniref:uncharacterized protein n=1 Tax=Penicillium samsonianum TaxID=1882272 RepID=UPI002548A975|nr:uncharacterized protein N7471_002236 [Penicillium samsonianum]KAJ6142783.1 hypothetical protein N7471_002236 [Penicillium samsonianum]
MKSSRTSGECEMSHEEYLANQSSWSGGDSFFIPPKWRKHVFRVILLDAAAAARAAEVEPSLCLLSNETTMILFLSNESVSPYVSTQNTSRFGKQ